MSTEDTLDEILEVLLDISESLSEIAANTRPSRMVELPDDFLGSLHSDGGLQVPKGEIRTYGDATVTPILSGDEEGLA